MKPKTKLNGSAAVRTATGGLATALVSRGPGHGSALARVTRAAFAGALFMAIGALWSAAAGAQQAEQAAPATQQTPAAQAEQAAPTTQPAPAAQADPAPTQSAPVAPATRPFGAPSVATGTSPSGIASLGQVTLALGLVLALIFVAAWAMRRLKGFGKTGTGALDIVAELPLSQKERAVLIRVGTQQLLIGVAPGRVTTLHVLDEPVNITPPSRGDTPGAPGIDRPNFKSLLMKSLGK